MPRFPFGKLPGSAQRKFFAMLGAGIVGTVKRGGTEARRLSRRLNPADMIESSRKTNVGAFVESIATDAKSHEYAESIKKGDLAKSTTTKGLQNVAGKAVDVVGHGVGKFQGRLLKALKKNPLLRYTAQTVGTVGTIGGKFARRHLNTIIEGAQNDPKVRAAREAGSIITEHIGKTDLRGLARGIRRDKSFFGKKITQPILKSLTGHVEFRPTVKGKPPVESYAKGKSVTVPKSAGRTTEVVNVPAGTPGLGHDPERHYGSLQGLRRIMAGDDAVKRNKLDTEIQEAISFRREKRSNFTTTIKEARKNTKRRIDEGLITAEQGKLEIENTIKRAKENFKGELESASNVYRRSQDTDNGKVFKTGKLVGLFKNRYKGADIDLTGAATTGAATVYFANQQGKVVREKIQRMKYSHERKKADDLLYRREYVKLLTDNPELNEYEIENLARRRVHDFRKFQAESAGRVGLTEALLQAVPATSQSSKPRESNMKLKKVISKYKKK